jgi:hypothetical protein
MPNQFRALTTPPWTMSRTLGSDRSSDRASIRQLSRAFEKGAFPLRLALFLARAQPYMLTIANGIRSIGIPERYWRPLRPFDRLLSFLHVRLRHGRQALSEPASRCGRRLACAQRRQRGTNQVLNVSVAFSIACAEAPGGSIGFGGELFAS